MSIRRFCVFENEKKIRKDAIVQCETIDIKLEVVKPRVYVDYNEHYVYVLLDSRKPGNFKYYGLDYEFEYEPFYVGKGYGNRCYDHEKEAKYFSDKKEKILHIHNPLKIRIIHKCWEIGKDIMIVKIKENITDKKAQQVEMETIKFIGRRDKRTGPLSNMTDGGDGHRGVVYTEGQKEKQRQKLKGKNSHTELWLKRVLEVHKGKIVKESTKQKLREKAKAQMTVENRKRLSEMRKGNIIPEEIRRKISNTLKGRIVTEETRKKMSISGKGRKFTEESRKKMSESKRGKSTWNKGIKWKRIKNRKGAINA